MSKLLPCRVCGNLPELKGNDGSAYSFTCTCSEDCWNDLNCYSGSWWYTQEDAAMEWNARMRNPTPIMLVDLPDITCPHCGHKTKDSWKHWNISDEMICANWRHWSMSSKVTCYHCKKVFIVRTEYAAERIEDWLLATAIRESDR